ncbi:nucleolar GTP-binding protein 1-like [Vespa crabro]|uniref:nucleolar GTP-binding protein 1-like n=1 Tax=Vespa crabro TaxID=7445 RepID=UPI001F0039E3|nr:nucleolar GTP-binding protein 1-like [Vespa crabro]XP_046820773.1 nucleolar GTP-binding protein 1-like [Vespa crabro]
MDVKTQTCEIQRDEKIRPRILESVLHKKQATVDKMEQKQKLEKIEEEMGDDYVFDLKKNYDIEGEKKYDIIPEIWEGHNMRITLVQIYSRMKLKQLK